MPIKAEGPSRYTKAKMREQAAGVQPRALSIPEFCSTYSISRGKCYAEIKSGRLKVRKLGPRAVRIPVEAANAWFASFSEEA